MVSKDKNFLFSSESVSEGHPDKICDQISDAILDAFLAGDVNSRVACETLVTTNFVCIAGEVSSKTQVNIEEVVREVIRKIGYTDQDIGFDTDSAKVEVLLHSQSPDIAQGITEDQGIHKGQGAGDQGIMFGYACNDTSEYMPMPIALAHQLMRYLAKKRHSNEITAVYPDAKCQVSVRYQNNRPVSVETVVLSTQHRSEISHKQLEELMIESVIKKVIPPELAKNTRYLINPTGKFEVGGPQGDAGLTGRKIIVDTYGGWSRHGGGAFSGKDPSKVDRSAAYMARYAAKNIVAAGLADECELQLAYAIGYPEPVSIAINTNGTNHVTEQVIQQKITEVFDFSPAGIMESLQLTAPQRKYLETACYGHFGRSGETFSWEITDQVEKLRV